VIRFEVLVAIFGTLLSLMFTGFFLDELSRPFNPYIDTTFSRVVMPLGVLAFMWGTILVMWFAIASGRHLFK
jgi:hypothetical protein